MLVVSRSVAWTPTLVFAASLLVSCSTPPNTRETQPAELTTKVQVRTEIVSIPRSFMQLSSDDVPGRLLFRGEVVAPEPCGEVSVSAHTRGRQQLELRLTRQPPGDEKVCFGMVGRFVVSGEVYPLASGSYQVTVRHQHLRRDGSAQLDENIADTTVTIR